MVQTIRFRASFLKKKFVLYFTIILFRAVVGDGEENYICLEPISTDHTKLKVINSGDTCRGDLFQLYRTVLPRALSLRNLVWGYKCGRIFPVGVGPHSSSKDAANWMSS